MFIRTLIILLFVSSVSYSQTCSFEKSFEKILIMESAVITYGVIGYLEYNSIIIQREEEFLNKK